jgi:integrase
LPSGTYLAREALMVVHAKARKSSFGNLRTLPSGRIQGRYTGPDGLTHLAPVTFETRGDAEAWLATVRADLVRGLWQPKSRAKPMTFEDYATAWLADRNLKPRTRAHYADLLDKHIYPKFGPFTLKTITPDAVRRWHAEMGTTRPTLRAHAYGLLRSILASAVQDQLIPVNPAHIRGAGTSRRVHKIKVATLAELEAIAAAMPQRFRLMVLLASWCAMRFGELAELRRGDVDLRNGVIHIRRAVARAGGRVVVSTPKSDAGTRDVAIPPHLLPMVKEHLRDDITGGKDGLLFPAADGVSHLATSTLYKHFYTAREAAGRPDLRWHDLRHTGAVLAASTGATLAELMGRLGHSTPAAALRYQHTAAGRDMEIAKALSALVDGGRHG